MLRSIDHNDQSSNVENENSKEDDDISLLDEISANKAEENSKSYGCKHYKRKCSLVCPQAQCDGVFPCRICHDDEIFKHSFDRHAVKEVVCCICNSKQPVSKTCASCDTIFGKYFCSICNLFDDCDKGQFHCIKCGICRVGGEENFFHCDKCGLCLGKGLQDHHRCIEKASLANCPVCMEDIHTSRDGAHIPKCGHLLHNRCYKALLENNEYRCPICCVSTVPMESSWRSLDLEISQTPMPEEYANIWQWILCNDCHHVSKARFHCLGMKCVSCGSYNTCGASEPSTSAQNKDDDDRAEVSRTNEEEPTLDDLD